LDLSNLETLAVLETGVERRSERINNFL